MTILSVAYPLLPVSSDSGGGAEQILYLLDRELVERGHRSIVIAATGSRVLGELIESPTFCGEITEEVRQDAQRDHLHCIENALKRYAIDLIHFHGLDFYRYLPEAKAPKLATLHLPLAWYPDWIFNLPEVQLNCVSKAQADGRALPFVENGIDVERYRVGRGQKKHLLWLGRICPEKGVHVALEVAHRLDLPMIVAGPVHPFRDHERYFEQKVQPLFDAKRQYAGAVALAAKIDLFAQAICVLIPSLVEETSSLVAMEAAAAGTPVIAYRAGALPEIVEHGVTGFIVDSQDQMADAVRRAGEISPETCRQRANDRFAAGRMAGDYFTLYAAQ